MRPEWLVPAFLTGCDPDFCLLLMYSGCGVQAAAVHGAFPWAALSQGQGSWLQAVSRQRSIFLPHSCCSFDSPCADRVVTSINIKFHQPSPTRDFCTWRWFLFLVGAGQCIRGQCSYQWEKYRYKLTSDPCALASTLFLQILQLRKNKRVDEGQG